MSMRAEVLVIGPKATLEKHGVLDYPLRFYADVPDEAMVLGTAAGAPTTSGSYLLAQVCGVEAWDLGNHRIVNPAPLQDFDDDEYVGEDKAADIAVLLALLLAEPSVQLWYRPNG